MIANYELGKYDSFKADIQDKIGDFLKCKKILTDLAYREDEFSSRALELLETQVDLENGLSEALTILEELNQGIYDPMNIANLSGIAANLTIHLSNVYDLQIQAGTAKGIFGLPITNKQILIGLSSGLMLYIFYRWLKKKITRKEVI